MANYTSGPWEQKSIPDRLFEIHNTNGDIILRLRSGMIPTVGDARLIQAAPKLLEACKLAFEVFGNSASTDHMKAMALIALEQARRSAEDEGGH